MRVVLFTGKGGVGKTTLAAATAVHLAAAGRPALAVSTDPAHSLGDALEADLDGEPRELAPGLWGAHIETRALLDRSWAELQGHLRTLLAGAGVDELVADELTVLPGVEDLLALGEVRRFADGGPWEVVVVDCGPTAETLRLLGLPEAISGYLERLFPAHRRAVRGLLAGLAGGGRALELGIGTGRVALPLAARGVEVHGIDSSEAMVAKLRAKPGGDRIPVTMGSFVDLPVEGAFALVYVPFNTFFAPLTQEEQVRCMASVAAHLEPGGRFVIDAFVPDPARFARGQAWEVQRIETDAMLIEAVRHDPVGQRLAMQRVVMTAEGTRMFPVNVRYAWPAELDLMARLAGLDLEHRWGGWRRQPFGAESRAHVSVYRRPGAGAGTADR